jgi:predicted phage terminase large subunit-like protein
MKGDPAADYSVATVWLSRGNTSYLLDLWRERVDFPNLKRAVQRLREKHQGATLIVEDKGSGTSLVQELRANNNAVIPITPEGDKTTRLANASVQFEAGAVLFPRAAPWLDALKAELLGFPNTRHDDQVDSVSQALIWMANHRRMNVIPIVAPIIISTPRRYFGEMPPWY